MDLQPTYRTYTVNSHIKIQNLPDTILLLGDLLSRRASTPVVPSPGLVPSSQGEGPKGFFGFGGTRVRVEVFSDKALLRRDNALMLRHDNQEAGLIKRRL